MGRPLVVPGPQVDQLGHLAGRPAPVLQVTLGCPACEGEMLVENGLRRAVVGVGVEAYLVVRCEDHGAYEVAVTLKRCPDAAKRKVTSAERRRLAKAQEGTG